MTGPSSWLTLLEPCRFSIRRRLTRSLFILFVVARIVDGAELPTPEEIVAQAGMACEALIGAANSRRQPGLQERFDQELRQRAWLRLALARVNLGDFDGAVEALNRVNSDPRFSQMSVHAMRTELTGIVPRWPENLPRRMKETQKAVLVGILGKQGRFEAALEMARDIADEQIRAQLTAQTLLARSRSLEKSDRNAALKDQLQVMELASSIRDPQSVREMQYEVCRGQIRLGPPELARILIRVFTEKLKEAEQKAPRADTVQEWLRFGELCLLTDDHPSAKECFEHARQRFATTNPGKEWDQSLPRHLTLHYRCRAYREADRLALIPDVLDEWERAFSKLTDPKDKSFVAPFLVSNEIQADRVDHASTMIQALDDPIKAIVVQQAADEIQRSASAAQKTAFANYLKTRLAEPDELRQEMLTLAAELFDSADDKESADRSISEAMESSERKKDYRPLIAGWLAEHGRFGKAYDLIGTIDDPKQRAQALAELAYEMTTPRKP